MTMTTGRTLEERQLELRQVETEGDLLRDPRYRRSPEMQAAWDAVEPDRVARRINGCPIVLEIGKYQIIDHPEGFMVYRGWRVGTRATLSAAVRLVDRKISEERSR